MIAYSNVRVYTYEMSRYEGKPLVNQILYYIKSLKTAARCVVVRGYGGVDENGEIVSHSLVDPTYNMPLMIDILLPEQDTPPVLETLSTMVLNGALCVLPATERG